MKRVKNEEVVTDKNGVLLDIGDKIVYSLRECDVPEGYPASGEAVITDLRPNDMYPVWVESQDKQTSKKFTSEEVEIVREKENSVGKNVVMKYQRVGTSMYHDKKIYLKGRFLIPNEFTLDFSGKVGVKLIDFNGMETYKWIPEDELFFFTPIDGEEEGADLEKGDTVIFRTLDSFKVGEVLHINSEEYTDVLEFVVLDKESDLADIIDARLLEGKVIPKEEADFL